PVTYSCSSPRGECGDPDETLDLKGQKLIATDVDMTPGVLVFAGSTHGRCCAHDAAPTSVTKGIEGAWTQSEPTAGRS
ncbi:hypothetical protein, partial [Microbacterium maritypicum]|uniref:hypothetical protein n=1 Tax=Microbacterium maritypicum TaxID=33918 RepID=UPI0022E5CA68